MNLLVRNPLGIGKMELECGPRDDITIRLAVLIGTFEQPFPKSTVLGRSFGPSTPDVVVTHPKTGVQRS